MVCFMAIQCGGPAFNMNLFNKLIANAIFTLVLLARIKYYFFCIVAFHLLASLDPNALLNFKRSITNAEFGSSSPCWSKKRFFHYSPTSGRSLLLFCGTPLYERCVKHHRHNGTLERHTEVVTSLMRGPTCPSVLIVGDGPISPISHL